MPCSFLKFVLLVFWSLVLFFAPFAAQAAMKLSLAQALELVEQSPQIKIVNTAVDQSQALLSQARGMFYPMITASEQYARTNNPVNVFGAKMQQGIFTVADFDINTLNNPASISHWSTEFKVMQPILNSAVDIYRYRAAWDNVKAQRHAIEYQRLALRLQVRTMYFHTTALKEKISVNNMAIKRLSDLEKSYELIQAPTSANTTNYFVTQSLRLSLEAQKTWLSMNHSNSQRNLLALIGLSPMDEVHLTDSFYSAEKTTTQTRWSEVSERSDVLAAKQAVKTALNSLRAAKWSWGPRLDLLASYNIYTGDFHQNSGAYAVGVALSWPVFEGWRLGKIQEAAVLKNQAIHNRDMVTLNAQANRKNNHESLAQSQKQLTQILSASAKATEALSVAKTRYAEGTLPLFDYSQSIQNWALIQHQVIDSRLGLALAKSQFLFERGEP